MNTIQTNTRYNPDVRTTDGLLLETIRLINDFQGLFRKIKDIPMINLEVANMEPINDNDIGG
jgi:hypothetical protein